MPGYFLRVVDALSPYNYVGEVVVSGAEIEDELDGIGTFSATCERGGPGAVNLDFALTVRRTGDVFAYLRQGVAASSLGGGVMDELAKHGPDGAITVKGMGYGIELTTRLIMYLPLWTSFGTAPMPANLILGAILAYAPSGWSATGTPSAAVHYDLRTMTVFEALQKVAELTGDHFRINGRVIVWLASPGASTVRAVSAAGAAVEDNPAVCTISEITQTSSGQALYTRIFPFGGGDADYHLTLAATTRASAPGLRPGDYTDSFYALHIDADPQLSYIADTNAESNFGRIDATITLDDIVPLAPTAAGVLAASNQLYDTARALLAQSAVLRYSYRLTLGNVQARLYPGDYLYVDYHDYERREDGTTDRYLDINGDLLLLSVRDTLDEGAALTVEVEVTTSPIGDWPQEQADVIAKLRRRIAANSKYEATTLRTETFTMTATVTLTINDDRVSTSSYIPIIPLNAAAVTRQAGAGYLEALPGNKLIQFQTHDGIAAAGTEQYRYQVVNP